uniref:Uncharacterized protein n=1 Tax=Arundo donax TaxID=35708 RepID=A0A0A8YL07_ARUDO
MFFFVIIPSSESTISASSPFFLEPTSTFRFYPFLESLALRSIFLKPFCFLSLPVSLGERAP